MLTVDQAQEFDGPALFCDPHGNGWKATFDSFSAEKWGAEMPTEMRTEMATGIRSTEMDQKRRSIYKDQDGQVLGTTRVFLPDMALPTRHP